MNVEKSPLNDSGWSIGSYCNNCWMDWRDGHGHNGINHVVFTLRRFLWRTISRSEATTKPVKYLNISWMAFCDDIRCSRMIPCLLLSLQTYSWFWGKWLRLLDGLFSNVVQTFMFFSGLIIIRLVNLIIFFLTLFIALLLSSWPSLQMLLSWCIHQSVCGLMSTLGWLLASPCS